MDCLELERSYLEHFFKEPLDGYKFKVQKFCNLRWEDIYFPFSNFEPLLHWCKSWGYVSDFYRIVRVTPSGNVDAVFSLPILIRGFNDD